MFYIPLPLLEDRKLIWNQNSYNWSQHWTFMKEWLRSIFLLKLRLNNLAGLRPILAMDQFRGSSRDHIIFCVDMIMHWWEMVHGENWFFANRNHIRIWRQRKVCNQKHINSKLFNMFGFCITINLKGLCITIINIHSL